VSNTAPLDQAAAAPSPAARGPVRELLSGRSVVLGGVRGFEVIRTLPQRQRSTIGAWCFADTYGPVPLNSSGVASGDPGMRVPPHPHTGLQTVTWLVDGDVLHRDSLGNSRVVRPGQLNLMTAGHGIAHSEESTPDRPQVLHGAQLWVALPEGQRDGPAHFEHHADLPRRIEGGVTVTVIVGELDGAASPARAYTGLFGAEVAFTGAAAAGLPLDPDFEYGVLTLHGSVDVDGVPLEAGPLLYLGRGRTAVDLRAERAARLLLLGGEPYDAPLVMWWNFVGRDHDDIVAARQDWVAGRHRGGASGNSRFGEVHGYPGDPLPAPALPTTRLLPRRRE
jgi:redox-sensitive bicupin YhaK (pirin superfamily)